MLNIILFLTTLAHGAETTQPCDRAAVVYDEIKPQAKTIQYVRDGDTCKITWTPKDGVTVTFTNYASRRQAILDELAAIEAKLDDGTATVADVRRAVKLILRLGRWDQRP